MKLIVNRVDDTMNFGLLDNNGLKLYSFTHQILTSQEGIAVDCDALYPQICKKRFWDYFCLFLKRIWKISLNDIDSIYIAEQSWEYTEFNFKMNNKRSCYTVEIALAMALALRQDILSENLMIIIYMSEYWTNWTAISNGKVLHSDSYSGILCNDYDSFGRFNFNHANVEFQVERFKKVFHRVIDELIPEEIGRSSENAQIFVVSEKELHPLLKKGLQQDFGNRLTIEEDGKYLAISGVCEMLKDTEKYNSLLLDIHDKRI